MCKRIHTTNSSCSPRGAVTLYDTSGCSFTASALKEGISYIIVKFKLFCIFSIFISQRIIFTIYRKVGENSMQICLTPMPPRKENKGTNNNAMSTLKLKIEKGQHRCYVSSSN